jgi:hypothetical protein
MFARQTSQRPQQCGIGIDEVFPAQVLGSEARAPTLVSMS